MNKLCSVVGTGTYNPEAYPAWVLYVGVLAIVIILYLVYRSIKPGELLTILQQAIRSELFRVVAIVILAMIGGSIIMAYVGHDEPDKTVTAEEHQVDC